MPLELNIIRANEFVRLNPGGHLNFQESKAALKALAAACLKRSIDSALLDLRGITVPLKPFFTSAELAALVASFRDAGFSKSQKLAVLYRDDPHHGARMFAFISAMRGLKVRAFKDFEQAVQWLSEQKGTPHEAGEHEVPIQTRRKIDVKGM